MSVIKYKLIKNELLKEINNGLFKPGQKFYSESELKKRYDVSSATAIKALQELVSDGILVRYQGKGSFISKAKRNEKIFLTEKDKTSKGTEKINLINTSLESEASIAQRLNLSQNEQYYKVIRTRSINKKTFLVQVSYIAHKFVKDVSIFENNQYQSIYAALNSINKFDMYSLPFKQTIHIIKAVPTFCQALLQIDAKEPVVFMTRYTFDENKQIIEYVETYKTTETFHIEIKNTEEIDDE